MARTVGELIEQLKQYPLDAKLIMSQDPEGNYFHATGVDTTIGYLSSDIEFYSEEGYKELKEEEDEDDFIDDFEQVVCLWP